MNQSDYEELIKGLLDPETTKEANKTLNEFLSDPQSILFLLQMIESPSSEQIKISSINFLSIYMDKNFEKLEQDLQDQILDKLIEITFSEKYLNSDLLYPILCDYINQEKSISVLRIIDQCFSESHGTTLAMNILSELITNFDEEERQNLLSGSQEQFLNYTISGLQSNKWEMIYPSMIVFYYLKKNNPELPNDPFFDIIIKNGIETDLYKNEQFFGKYWVIIGKMISSDIVPNEKLEEIYNVVIGLSSDEKIPYSDRIIPLYSLVGVVKSFNDEQVSTVLNLVFSIAMSCVEQDEIIPTDYFDLINKALTDLPLKDIYSMLKERITHLLSLQDRSAHVVSIVIYSVVFDIAPNAAFLDIDSIIEDLFSALEKDDVLLNTAVCIVLCSFLDSFRSVDVYAIHFLPKIVPFIISPNNDLRLQANNALHTICDLITVPVQGFFEALWQIKDQIPETDFDSYLTYIATAIEKSDELSDADTEALKEELLLPNITNFEDPNAASIFLSVLVTLVTTNESFVEELLPPSINVMLACLTSADINDSSIINCLFFVTNFYETFGNKYDEMFNDVIKLVLNILFPEDENEEDDDDENETGDSVKVKSAALEACCTYAKSTGNRSLAKRLQEKCVYFFTHEYANDVNEQDDEDEVIEGAEDIECNAIKEGSNSSCLIAKLLDQEDKKQLFMNIYNYIIETTYAECASEALKPFTKLVHIANDDEKEFYLKYSYLLLNSIVDSSFKAFNGKDIFNDQIDLYLMTNIAYLICECVRYKSSTVDELCEFMIHIIESSLDSAYLYAFIGAYSDVIKFNTGSAEAIQAILDLLPQLIENAKDPDTKLNITYLLSLLVQKDPQSIQNVQDFIPTLQQWYEKGKESPNGNQIMLSNIASAFLTFMSNGMEVDDTLLKEAVSEFPPDDTKETSPMIQNMAKVFSSSKLTLECVEIAAFSLSKFFLLSDMEMQKRKVSDELKETAYQMFITFSKSNPQIIEKILSKYQNTKAKLEKLQQILSENN